MVNVMALGHGTCSLIREQVGHGDMGGMRRAHEKAGQKRASQL